MYNVIDTNEIYGLRTVNCGEILEFDDPDLVNPMRNLMIEVLRPERHNPNAQIICYYLWDTHTCTKVEITVYKLSNGTMGSEIYYFRSKGALQHHKSYNFPNFFNVPKKFQYIVRYLTQIFNEVYC